MDKGTEIEGLDKGMERAVFLLREAGIETFTSCDGGEGHPYREPTIRFKGNHDEGFVALGVVLFNALPVVALKRVWRMIRDEPTGPIWELTFLSASLACPNFDIRAANVPAHDKDLFEASFEDAQTEADMQTAYRKELQRRNAELQAAIDEVAQIARQGGEYKAVPTLQVARRLLCPLATKKGESNG